MEANSKFEQLFSAKQALEEMQYYYQTVKDVNGVCCTVFHNHFITTQPECIAWRKMYETFLEKNC
jgi:hypothetical protein